MNETPGLLDESLHPILLRFQGMLNEYDLVVQMKILEMLAVRLAMGMQRRTDQDLVVNSFHKHVRQIVAQWRRFEAAAS